MFSLAFVVHTQLNSFDILGNKMLLSCGDDLGYCFRHGVEVAEAGLLHELADKNDVCKALESVLLRELSGGDEADGDIVSLDLALNKRAVKNNYSAGNDAVDELVIRRAVHRNEHIRSDNEGRADWVGRDTDAAVCRAASHLGTVGRKP